MHDLIRPDASFTPRELFSRMQGAWFEPRQGSMWQENTGVTPTTSVGQTIGKLVDLSADRVASQATAANRPIYGARRNLLTYTEDFSNAVWVKINLGAGSLPILTTNYGIAPDGTLTAARLQLNGGGNTASDISAFSQDGLATTQDVTQTWWMKSTDSNSYVVNIVSVLLSSGDSIKNVTVTPTWTKFTATTGPTNGTIRLRLRGTTGSSQIADILIWHPDLRLTSDVGKDPAPYQRITTATDYDAGRFPAIRHASTQFLTASLPDLGGGVFSSNGSIYWVTPTGMQSQHGQAISTSLSLPAANTNVYSCLVTPERLNAVYENKLGLYFLRLAGLL